MADGLPFGRLGAGTLHLCIDMQTLFAERTDWHLPWLERVLPAVLRIARAHTERTVFTRFVPPEKPDEMPGAWQRYYARWRHMTQDRLDPRLIELVPPLAELVPPAAVLDKRHYSPFAEPELPGLLRQQRIDTLVITGAETDVCVLSTVLSAVDLGFRVVIVQDALCSSSDVGHDALMTMYRTRFHGQVDLVTAEELAEFWRE
jgi:nicotinamidase-related amidase